MTEEMLRVYFETTVFNRYYEEGREYNPETKQLFQMISYGEVTAYTSVAVLQEIDKAPKLKREEMMSLLTSYDFTVLEVEQNAYDLADLYVEMGVIPARFRMDGVHIAMSAVNDLDCIVSLNFHHINKLKTKMTTEIIHRMKGYGNPAICTPMEVTNHEK
ncbi:MAG: hypothetical protein FWF47_03500 [Clostridia bacterium]|nr:hypothetical protein [Clostridia bacterium]